MEMNGKEYQEGQLITQEQKAKELGISYRTLSRWIRQGRLTFIRLPNTNRKFFTTGATEKTKKHARYGRNHAS